MGTQIPAPAAARPVPLSGRYRGEMSAPAAGRSALELRIDIDPTGANTPVANRISGDFFDINSVPIPGGLPRTWQVYRESWIVDQPEVRCFAGAIEITGTMRYWKGSHPATLITISIAWDELALGQAEVTLQETGSAASSRFTCDQVSHFFRELSIEVAACSSISQQPILPAYNTGAHNNRPTDVQARVLDIPKAYAEAGVRVSIDPTIRPIDDSAVSLRAWSSAELYDALQTYFSLAGSEWPRWAMWGILATSFDTPSVGGIMFDVQQERGAAGSPERKGFAVFRNHSWFSALRDGDPTTQNEAAAARQFLYTWVHEAGHAFNFLHSWNKNRPDALSWMNYDWKYDSRNGSNRYWSRFRFRFDDEELIHLRHGDRASVIMGGDPWGASGSASAPPSAEYLRFAPGAMAQAEGNVPLEVLIRSKTYFEFLEPVEIELRLRNLLDNYPLQIDTNLALDYGTVTLYIRRPDGRILEFAPVTCRVAEPAGKLLASSNEGAESGENRHSTLLQLTYGSPGFYFDHPGEYQLRAVYNGLGDIAIPSNMIRLRVGSPTKERDIFAQDFFEHKVGLNLAFNGSASPYLRKGLDVIRTACEQYADTALGAKMAVVAANALGRPFYRVENDKLTQSHKPDFATAISLSERAVNTWKSSAAAQPEVASNLLLQRAASAKADLLARSGRVAQGRSELMTLSKDLLGRGVPSAAVRGIETSAKLLDTSGLPADIRPEGLTADPEAVESVSLATELRTSSRKKSTARTKKPRR